MMVMLTHGAKTQPRWSWCQCLGLHGTCLQALLLYWHLGRELAWLLAKGQLHWLLSAAVLDAHADSRQQVDHSQQCEVAKIHIKLQKRW